MKRKSQVSSLEREPSLDSTEQLMNLQSDIVKQVSALQRFKKNNESSFYLTEPQEDLKYDKNNNYYDLFWKILIINHSMVSQIKDLIHFNSQFQTKMQKTNQKVEKLIINLTQKGRRKNRRLDTEIDKKFLCSYPNCFKVYGSSVSLNLHIKIKHNGGTKTYRHNLGKQYLKAIQEGLPLPEIDINLPPDFIDNLKKQQNLIENEDQIDK